MTVKNRLIAIAEVAGLTVALAVVTSSPWSLALAKWVTAGIAAIFLLAGCSTVSFSSPPPSRLLATTPAAAREVVLEAPSQAALATPAATLLPPQTAAVPTPATYRYGRFIVEVTDKGQEVLGGEFVPETKLPAAATAEHVVFIDYTTKELLYYRKLASGRYEAVIGFAVVTPLASSLPNTIVRGRVTKLVYKPSWCPKVGGSVRRDDTSLPKGCLPYGHPQNAMGDWRFDVAWSVKGWDLIKVHGTTGYPRGSFWLEDTHGCTRLENRAIKRLVEILGQNAVKEGIEVILLKGNSLLLHAL